MKKILTLLFAFCASLPLLAQTTPAAAPQLTWIRYFDVERGQAEEFMNTTAQYTAPVLDRLLAERKISSWGVAVPLTLAKQDFTHFLWISLPNWAAGDELLRALDAADKGRSADERKRLSELSAVTFRPRSTYDMVLRHQEQSAPIAGATFNPAFIRVAYYTAKPGRSNDLVALFREAAAPVYNDMQRRGVIGPWGLSTQEAVTSDDFTHMVWYFIDDLASIDEVRAAAMAISPNVRDARNARVQEATETDEFRSEIYRIVHVGGRK